MLKLLWQENLKQPFWELLHNVEQKIEQLFIKGQMLLVSGVNLF